VFFMEGCAAYIGLIFAIFDKQHTRWELNLSLPIGSWTNSANTKTIEMC
jgi:hypothetical protein